MGWRIAKAALLSLSMGALGTACVGEPTDGAARLAAIHSEAKGINDSLDQVEGRLLEDQSNVHLWAELKERHQHVSAVAVTNQNGHFAEMVRLLDAQQEKARKLHRPRAVAENDTVLSKAVATRSKTRRAREQ